MNTTRREFLKLGLTLGAGAALQPLLGCEAKAALHSRREYLFGTEVELAVESASPREGEMALSEVVERFTGMNRDWHAWKPGALSRLNARLAAGEMAEVDTELASLIDGARALSARSGGLFNPALGELIALWDFQSDTQTRRAPPEAAQIAALCAHAPRMDALHIEATADGARIHSASPHVRLDFGGYAKGVALDRALDQFAGRGLGNAVVNLGGNLAVSGRRQGRPWRIGVRHPQGEGVIAALEVEGRAAVVTSGTYERYREWNGERYPHIIDPRTGYPARHIASATVLHPEGGLADAAATALVVAGPQDWPRIARAFGIREALVVDETGAVQLTPAMARRAQVQEGVPVRVV
ncbi:MAG: FAD:protein FMN transferase [Halothiobacillaceae bacterium]|nr:FAD:protein FMN transferase [Halothiobacillaceae bacterium]